VNLKSISYLLVILFFLSSASLAQEQLKPNSEFYHTWLQYDLYEHLMSGKTPSEFQSPLNLVAQVYFYENSKRILIGNFYEGVHQQFKVKNKDTIEVTYPGTNKIEFVLTLTAINDKTVLVIKREDKTYFLASLDDKYHVENGIDYFINDKFFTGNYISEDDSTQKITFTSDGKVIGIDNFNEYTLPIEGVPLPREYDIVLLFVINKATGRINQNLTTMMHWKKSKDKITLYKVSRNATSECDVDGKFIGAKILGKYLTLKKVD